MLEQFTPTINSDNRFKFLDFNEYDTIVAGETCTHTFHLPFKYTDVVCCTDIIYSQGFELVLQKCCCNIEIIEEDDNTTTIQSILQPDESLVFTDTLLDSFVQLKLRLKNGSIIYSEPRKLKVYIPLEYREV